MYPIKPSKNHQLPIIIAIILIGLNLRPPISSIGSLMAFIKEDVPLNFTDSALLTTLPIFTVGLVMLIFRSILTKCNAFSLVIIALVILGFSNLFRGYVGDNGYPLFITATTVGGSIAIIQTALPIVIKKNFPNRVALYIGLYLTAIMAGEVLATTLSPIVQQLTHNWHIALSCWGILAIVALIAWFPIKNMVENIKDSQQLNSVPIKFYKIKRTWFLCLFCSIGVIFYMCILTWLPTYYSDEYQFNNIHAGLLLSLFATMQTISGLMFPALANRSLDRRPSLYLATALMLIAFTGLIFSPTYLYMIWVSLLGLGNGGLFTLGVIVVMDHYSDPVQSGELNAFVAGVSYLIGSFSPLITGMIKDLTKSFSIAWGLLLLVSMVLLIMIHAFNPKTYKQKMLHH